MDIFNRIFSEITSVCRTILRFFNILLLQQRNLDIQNRFMPIYSLPTKSYPDLNGKKIMQTLQPDINLTMVSNENLLKNACTYRLRVIRKEECFMWRLLHMMVHSSCHSRHHGWVVTMRHPGWGVTMHLRRRHHGRRPSRCRCAMNWLQVKVIGSDSSIIRKFHQKSNHTINLKQTKTCRKWHWPWINNFLSNRDHL